MINKFIRNFVAKQIAGRSDDGIMITLKDPQKVTLAENIMAELLMRNGIDPRIIGSEQELKFLLQQIENARIREIQNTGIKNTESAKVFNIEGQQLDPNKPIMGGTQTGKELSKELSDRLSGKNTELIKQRIADKKIESDEPPPGSRGGEDDIAAPVMNVEDAPEGFIDFVRTKDPEAAAKLQKAEDDIKAKIEAGNKRYLEKIKKQKEEGTYKRYNPEEGSQLDLQIKEEYQKAIRGESKLFAGKFEGTEDDFRNMLDEMTDDFASGGRVGFKGGLSKLLKEFMERRKFLKTMVGNTEKNKRARELDMLKETMEKARENPGFEFPSGKELRTEIEKKIGPILLKDRKLNADGGRIGLKIGTGKRFLQRVFGKERFEEMKSRDPEMYVGLLEVVDMYRKRDKEGLKMYLQKFLPHMDDAEIEAFIIGSDGTEGLVGELIRLGSGRDYAGKIEMMKKAEEMKKLRDLEVTDDMIRKPNADGGIMRLGLKEGSGMSRRTFLKFLAGAASIPIVGKIFKPLKIGKTVTKVPIIKTDNVPGKPEWFDQLVNKVILEGDDVTKRFATVDREVVHMKKLDDDNQVLVYQDVDAGTVRVEYNSADNMFGEQVDLRYKKPNPDEGDPSPSAEFEVEESGIVGRADGPDDYSMEVEGMGGSSISDLESDLTKLKTYATGQKPTIKELADSMKRKKNVRYYETPEGQTDYVTTRQGDEVPDYDDYADYASGGIARMLGE